MRDPRAGDGLSGHLPPILQLNKTEGHPQEGQSRTRRGGEGEDKPGQERITRHKDRSERLLQGQAERMPSMYGKVCKIWAMLEALRRNRLA